MFDVHFHRSYDSHPRRRSWLARGQLLAFVASLALLAVEAPTQDREDEEPSELELERVERSEAKPSPVAGPAPLPQESLPGRTRPPPDPASTQYVRGSVYVRVAEVIVDSADEITVPDVQVVDRYLQEYLRRAGFRIVDRPTAAEHRIEGDLEAVFVKVFRLQGKDIAYKVEASCEVSVLTPEGEERERLALPGVSQENVKSEKSAYLQVRRLSAKLLWERLRREGEVFSAAEAGALLDRLALTPVTGEVSLTTERVVARLAGQGLGAVPVLLEALTDTRPVLIEAKYPGLTAANRSKLRVYHIADKVLEEIFQKVSRMDLETPPRWRFVIIKGWENEWSRFCPPWRESPVRRAEAARAAEAKQRKTG